MFRSSFLLLLVALSGCGLFLDPDPPHGSGETDASSGMDSSGGGDAVVDGGLDAVTDDSDVTVDAIAPDAPPVPIDCDMLGDLEVCGSDPRQVCWAGACVVSRCGDGWRDDDVEACDDGNGIDGDGCDSDCTKSCIVDSDCDDDELCNGAEICTDAGCGGGELAPYGTPCDIGGLTGVCDEGFCVTSACGNGRVDSGEQCDDGNFVRNDGCEADCTYSCTTVADCTASSVACMGVRCSSMHICESVTLPAMRTCYEDGDGDGWGSGVTVMECRSSCSPGTSPLTGDCDDGDPRAHPFPSSSPSPFWTTPRASGGYDYDCVRGEERGLPGGSFGACRSDLVGGCMGAGWMGFTPDCGGSGTFVECVPDMGGSADACNPMVMSDRRMPCR